MPTNLKYKLADRNICLKMATTTTERANEILDDGTLAEEELIDELEKEEIPAHIREARLEALKKQSADLQLMKEKQHGLYTEIPVEKGFLDLTTQEDRCVIHFFHEDFRRCAIMDTHLEALTKKYFETKFAKINVDKAKYFVEKLKIRVLPAVLCFKNGVVVDRVIGFEELGNTDSFPTSVLEKRLGKSGVIEVPEVRAANKTVFGFNKPSEDCSSDDDDY